MPSSRVERYAEQIRWLEESAVQHLGSIGTLGVVAAGSAIAWTALKSLQAATLMRLASHESPQAALDALYEEMRAIDISRPQEAT